MMLRMCSRAPESVPVILAMVKEEETGFVVGILLMGLKKNRDSLNLNAMLQRRINVRLNAV
jgi:hypothetical protein